MGWFDDFGLGDLAGQIFSPEAGDIAPAAIDAANSAFTGAGEAAGDFGSPDMAAQAVQSAGDVAGGQDEFGATGAGLLQSQIPPPEPIGKNNPMMEAGRPPGQWWAGAQQIPQNMVNGVANNPWRTLGILGGIGAAAYGASQNGQPRPSNVNTNFPPPQFTPPSNVNTATDPTLPPPGNPSSPILKNGGMKVKTSSGL